MKTKDRVLWSAAAERAEMPPSPRECEPAPSDAVPGRQLRCRTPKSAEQSENVYENKGSAENSTTPDPSLSKEGNRELPSSDEEGLGVVRLCVLRVLCALA